MSVLELCLPRLAPSSDCICPPSVFCVGVCVVLCQVHLDTVGLLISASLPTRGRLCVGSLRACGCTHPPHCTTLPGH